MLPHEEVEALRNEVAVLRDQLRKKEELINELVSQVDKFKSVLQMYDGFPGQNDQQLKPRKNRLLGISAEPESSLTYEELLQTKFTNYKKTDSSRKIIKNAILDNDFMKNLEEFQISEITDCMYPVEYAQNLFIIKEGDIGSAVTKAGRFLSKMGPQKMFGELAILYNCTRTATVKALTDCKLWAIERQCFRTIMMRSGLLKQKEYIDFLKSVPSFKKLPNELLFKIVNVLDEVTYKKGDCIIRQGEKGDTFYIINNGTVNVTIKHDGTALTTTDQNMNITSITPFPSLTTLSSSSSSTSSTSEKFIRTLTRGEFFGERALQGEEVRSASIFAQSDLVTCLVIDRELKIKDSIKILPNVTLGVGGFGRVELVTLRENKSISFALKIMKKAQIVETRQQQHILNEKRIMLESNCNFIVKLYKTFKDNKYLYMLMEACLGGELWTILRDKGQFDEKTARFYASCAIEAFEYLHSRNIIYRDLKPENMLLDPFGYAKLTDFGFAKQLLPPGRKTWTFCGTPPFCGSDPMRTYNMILKGIDSIDFPRNISREAIDLIKKLCRDNPSERLGYQKRGIDDIRNHDWLKSFDFEKLKSRQLNPPFVPIIKSACDATNFDAYPPNRDPDPPDDFTGWDEEF
ncbi:cGMP-dependent protein kinase, isozyme 2 forms cD4/T1/T3A/T3B-like protein [Sarcoptes scabiei]|uniref:cGMP-dependent protein kinase n=1 Tax=Sarcoptes scabiei TaxID=52283 RepID=A0A132AIB8_SARSC|nr:cGMP-dependent protein kinase, isozyme 2 forms cD4/T1/T3A/T3B-like protein [Sarcoptes scabiei]